MNLIKLQTGTSAEAHDATSMHTCAQTLNGGVSVDLSSSVLLVPTEYSRPSQTAPYEGNCSSYEMKARIRNLNGLLIIDAFVASA